jgi:hypothetical protein
MKRQTVTRFGGVLIRRVETGLQDVQEAIQSHPVNPVHPVLSLFPDSVFESEKPG